MGQKEQLSEQVEVVSGFRARLRRVLDASGAPGKEALFRLVDAMVDVTEADHAAIFVLDRERIWPKAAGARRPTVELFRRFRELGPVDLAEVLELGALIDREEVAVIPDAPDSGLIPERWVHAFDIHSMALARAEMADGGLCLVGVNYRSPHRFSSEERELLRIGASVARGALSAVELSARLQRQSEVRQRFFAGLAALGSSMSLERVLASVVEGLSSLFAPKGYSVGLTASGRDDIRSGPTLPGGDRIVFPLRAGGKLHGYLTLEGGGSLDPGDLELVEAFAQQATLAIERAELLEGMRARLRRTEALRRLADSVAGSRPLRTVLRELNREVCAELKLECVEVVFRRRRVGELLGSRPPSRSELTLLARILHDGGEDIAPVDGPGLFAAAVPVRGRTAGLLLVGTTDGRETLSSEDEDLVRALASGLGEVAYKARLADSLRKAEAHLEIAEARRELTKRMGSTLGRTLEDLWRGLSDAVGRHSGSSEVLRDLTELRSLIARAFMEAQTAAESISALRVRRLGLWAGLRALARSFERVTGVDTELRTTGTPVRLASSIEEGVYAAAFEALSTLERRSRATAVVVTLSYEPSQIRLTVRDDGSGLEQRGDDGPLPGVHFGMRALREISGRLGGRLTVEPASPRGVTVELLVPLEPLATGEMEIRAEGSVTPLRSPESSEI